MIVSETKLISRALWLKALTRAERARITHDILRIFESTDSAERRGRLTGRLGPFSFDEPPLARDMNSKSLTEPEIDLLLEDLFDVLQRFAPLEPFWLRRIESAVLDSSHVLTDDLNRYSQMSLIPAFAFSLAAQARDGLRQHAQGLAKDYCLLPFDASLLDRMYMQQVSGILSRILGRTMVLELNVARLQNRLEGSTPAERFESFWRILSTREFAESILDEYPVLVRLIVSSVDNWSAAFLEFIHRLAADWKQIQSTFSPDRDPGTLVSIEPGAGDTHAGGRSVILLTFVSGFKLVYKPRSLSVDTQFDALVRWLNDRGDHHRLRVPLVLNRGSHGWTEFIKPDECTCPEEIDRFYHRQGAFLALLYALEATDFHLENLIASGEHPVPIDLEALFHPGAPIDLEVSTHSIAEAAMSDSVLRAGLLPQRVWMRPDSDGLELSAIGGSAGQLTPGPVPVFADSGTDRMRVVRQRINLAGSRNTPALNGSAVDPKAYTDSIIEGFNSVYRTLMTHRDELLDRNGPIQKFRDCRVRAVIRPTRDYATLLIESYHPDVLRNGRDRDELFDWLNRSAQKQPFLSRIVDAERNDLEAGDIPLFTTTPGSRHLFTSRSERIKDFFPESSLDRSRRKVQQFDEADLARQTWFIRASLATLSTECESSLTGSSRSAPDNEVASARPEDFIEASQDIASRLSDLAIKERGLISWIGLNLINDRTWNLLPIGLDLYGGTSGIALYFGYLGSVTGEEKYTVLSRRLSANLRENLLTALLKKESLRSALLGGFAGLGGFIYVLSHLGALWNDRSVLDDALELAHYIPKLVEDDRALDFIGGSAGCIGGLSSLHACTRSELTVEATRSCAEWLLQKATLQQAGIAWQSSFSTRPLTGISHGAAGISLALLRAASLTKESRFQQAALKAIDYERTVFSSEKRNWPDFRSDSPSMDLRYSLAWCHGAPGVGLARLRALDFMHEESQCRPVMDEIEAALETTWECGFGTNHSLCHGDLGNFELFLEASQRSEWFTWQEPARKISARILGAGTKHGWYCGVPFGVETPGFMTGLAGIGYGLLRAANPNVVPSVLLLDPPRS